MLVYTFRTYPHIDELKQIFPDVFVFDSLKEDMQDFEHLLTKNNGIVLGIADTSQQSRIEPVAINKFNNGKVNKSGPEKLHLSINPRLEDIQVARQPTSSFCNWTMYKIQNFINLNELSSHFSFVHLNIKDIDKLGVFST